MRVPSASVKDQYNGPAFQDYDNVNISLPSVISISVAPDLMGLIKLQIKTGVHLINVELSQLLTLSTGNILLHFDPKKYILNDFWCSMPSF